MTEISKILKWIREVDIKTIPYDVISIGWGPKTKDNVETGEYCIIFTVKEKKPLDDLKPEEIIPKNLEIPIDYIKSIIIKTDVIEPAFHKKLPTNCHTDSNTIDPVRQNRIRRRPLIGGIETMSQWGLFVGTLGVLVKDKTDGQVVALSNNHVFANSQLNAVLKVPNEQNFTSIIEISGYQPTGFWRTNEQNDYIGKCKRAVMVGDVDPTILFYDNDIPVLGETSSDAAILRLADYTLIDPVSSGNILNFDIKAPYQFATDEEIDSLAPNATNSGAPIFRSGRTMGPVGFPGNTFSCGLSVYSLNSALVGLYSGYASYFFDCFYVRGDRTAGSGGDSGSAMFALLNRNNPSLSAWKLIGLLFAGPNDDSYTIGCRITNIANALNIAPWDTKIPLLSSSSQTVTLTGDYSESVTLSGRTYYQTGYR